MKEPFLTKCNNYLWESTKGGKNMSDSPVRILPPMPSIRYDRYLPSAFDDGLTMYEVLVHMREYLNSVIASQNHVLEEWIKIKEWIDTQLETYAKEELLVLIEKGIFDDIIEGRLFQDLKNQMDDKLASAIADMRELVDSIVSASPVDVVDTVAELNSKYPNGRTGIVVVKADGYFYYYQNGAWLQGGLYIDPLTYPLVRTDGTAMQLNQSASWIANPDIISLKSGYYSVYIQMPNPDKPDYPDLDYPVAINFPPQIQGNMCLVEVIDHGSDGRTTYRVTVNSSGIIYTTTKEGDGTLNEWGYMVRDTESSPKQQYRLTFASGVTPHWRYGSTDEAQSSPTEDNLIVPITELNSGFYMGSIDAIEGVDNRQLPRDILLNQYYSAIIMRTDSERRTILLNGNYTGASWMGYTGIDGSNLIWDRLDKVTDKVDNDKLEFAFRMNSLPDTTFKTLIITDVHGQLDVGETQSTETNPLHYKNLEDLDLYINNNDATIHLGDWLDGNYPKLNSAKSLVKFGRTFYDKPKRYGIYGNHDYNGQWDGHAGNNAVNIGDMNYHFSKKELDMYLTPFNKGFYYVDDAVKKIRMIYLSSFDQSMMINPATGKLYSDPQNQGAFGKAQVLFYIDALKTVPTDYNVVVFTHNSFDNVFEDTVYFNGDTMRKVSEIYQSKGSEMVFTSDITGTNPEYSYFQVETLADFTLAKGKILAVVNGHRHEDNYILRGGIKYISLLCSRAESGSSDNKPPRSYHDKTSDAITLLEFDTVASKINLYRYGAGIERSINMFS